MVHADHRREVLRGDNKPNQNPTTTTIHPAPQPRHRLRGEPRGAPSRAGEHSLGEGLAQVDHHGGFLAAAAQALVQRHRGPGCSASAAAGPSSAAARWGLPPPLRGELPAAPARNSAVPPPPSAPRRRSPPIPQCSEAQRTPRRRRCVRRGADFPRLRCGGGLDTLRGEERVRPVRGSDGGAAVRRRSPGAALTPAKGSGDPGPLSPRRRAAGTRRPSR